MAGISALALALTAALACERGPFDRAMTVTATVVRASGGAHEGEILVRHVRPEWISTAEAKVVYSSETRFRGSADPRRLPEGTCLEIEASPAIMESIPPIVAAWEVRVTECPARSASAPGD